MIQHHHPTAIDGLVNATIAIFILLVVPVICGYGLFRVLAIFEFLNR